MLKTIQNTTPFNKAFLNLSFIYGMTLYAIYYAYTNDKWYLFLISLTLGVMHQIIGVIIGMHRLFTHRSFKTQRWKEVLLACWSVLCGIGDPISSATQHRAHHANSDTERDPHSPHQLGFWTVLLNIQALEPKELRDARTMMPKYWPKDLIKDPVILFIRKNYHRIWLCLLVSVFIIGGPPAVAFGLVVPCLICVIGGGLVNAFGHAHGYRNYDTPDKSTNSWIANLLGFGEGFQNNHHHAPKSPNFAMKPGEFDPSWWIIKHMFMSKPD